jgi:hypothetical protein
MRLHEPYPFLSTLRMVYKRPYLWEKETGWRKHRPLQPFRGIIHDIRRRLPYYWSDIRDGFNYRTFAATVRMVCLSYTSLDPRTQNADWEKSTL